MPPVTARPRRAGIVPWGTPDGSAALRRSISTGASPAGREHRPELPPPDSSHTSKADPRRSPAFICRQVAQFWMSLDTPADPDIAGSNRHPTSISLGRIDTRSRYRWVESTADPDIAGSNRQPIPISLGRIDTRPRYRWVESTPDPDIAGSNRRPAPISLGRIDSRPRYRWELHPAVPRPGSAVS